MTFTAVAVAVIITLVIMWAWATAQRLNRLHIRTDAARIKLQAALDRRAAVIAALVPECAHIAKAAEAISLSEPFFTDREAAEARLSEAIVHIAAPENPQLIDATARVQLAHRFYNDAVTDTRALRRRRLVRALRLAGTAPSPEYFDIVARPGS